MVSPASPSSFKEIAKQFIAHCFANKKKAKRVDFLFQFERKTEKTSMTICKGLEKNLHN